MNFDRWFLEQGKAAAPPAPKMLPDGLWENNGYFMATCRSCKQDYVWDAEPESFEQDRNYCGGSPRCVL